MRDNWFDGNFWNRQNYISFGASTKDGIHACISGRRTPNLYVIGSILSGSNTLYEGSGGGIAIITAMAAADAILKDGTEAENAK